MDGWMDGSLGDVALPLSSWDCCLHLCGEQGTASPKPGSQSLILDDDQWGWRRLAVYFQKQHEGLCAGRELAPSGTVWRAASV